MRLSSAIAVLAASAVLAGCGGDDGPVDYMRIAGGGLSFNYRYSEARAVVVGRQITPLPQGARVEALFDVPGENRREKISRPAVAGTLLYKLESSPLIKLQKGVPLKVTLLVIDGMGQELDREETQFISDVNREDLPSKPLVDPSRPNYVPLPENL